MQIKKCDLCKKEFEGHGHGPHPLKGEICCDTCHNTKVLPARFELAKKEKEETKNNGNN